MGSLNNAMRVTTHKMGTSATSLPDKEFYSVNKMVFETILYTILTFEVVFLCNRT